MTIDLPCPSHYTNDTTKVLSSLSIDFTGPEHDLVSPTKKSGLAASTFSLFICAYDPPLSDSRPHRSPSGGALGIKSRCLDPSEFMM